MTSDKLNKVYVIGHVGVEPMLSSAIMAIRENLENDCY